MLLLLLPPRLLLLSVCLGSCLLLLATGEPLALRDALERGPLSLNDMFREVEELMEDTQHILEEAVDQVCVTFYNHLALCWSEWRSLFHYIAHLTYWDKLSHGFCLMCSKYFPRLIVMSDLLCVWLALICHVQSSHIWQIFKCMSSFCCLVAPVDCIEGRYDLPRMKPNS